MNAIELEMRNFEILGFHQDLESKRVSRSEGVHITVLSMPRFSFVRVCEGGCVGGARGGRLARADPSMPLDSLNIHDKHHRYHHTQHITHL